MISLRLVPMVGFNGLVIGVEVTWFLPASFVSSVELGFGL